MERRERQHRGYRSLIAWQKSMDFAVRVLDLCDSIPMRAGAGVVSQLRPRLNETDRQRLARHFTASPEAYEYYLKGVATFSTIGSASANVVGDVHAGIELLGGRPVVSLGNVRWNRHDGAPQL